jgi:hypothetical protein
MSEDLEKHTDIWGDMCTAYIYFQKKQLDVISFILYDKTAKHVAAPYKRSARETRLYNGATKLNAALSTVGTSKANL